MPYQQSHTADQLHEDFKEQPLASFLWRNVREGLAFCDRDGRIIAGNKSMAQLFGYAISELAGRAINDLTVEDLDLTKYQATFDALQQDTLPEFSKETQFKHNNGKRMNGLLRLIHVPGGILALVQIVGFRATDITDLPEREIQQLLRFLVGDWVFKNWRHVGIVVATVFGLTNGVQIAEWIASLGQAPSQIIIEPPTGVDGVRQR